MQHALFYIWSHGTPGRLPVPPPAAWMHRDPRPAGKSADGDRKSRLGALARDAMQKSRQRIGFLGAGAVAGMEAAP